MGTESAGWFADPRNRYHGRYFNGESWTEHVCSDTFEQVVDPLGVSSATSDDDHHTPAVVQAARTIAVFDQAQIRQAQSRNQATQPARPVLDWSGLTRAGRRSLQLLVPITAFLTWLVLPGSAEIDVVTTRSIPQESPSGNAPSLMAFAQIDEDIAVATSGSPRWTHASTKCFTSPHAVQLEQSATITAGRYQVELCDGTVTLTPTANGGMVAGDGIDLPVGDGALVMADGVIVTWRLSRKLSGDPQAIFWDMTFWGDEYGLARSVRVPAVQDGDAAPRPPMPLPGGYVLTVPVDELDGDGLTIERPVTMWQTADA